jgi:hypothetical protein
MNWDGLKLKIESLDGRIDWRKVDGEFMGQTGEYGGARIAKAMELIFASP